MIVLAALQEFASEEDEVVQEGVSLLAEAVATRLYARGHRVTVAATIGVVSYGDGGAIPMQVTLLGRGATFREAVRDLGRHGVH